MAIKTTRLRWIEGSVSPDNEHIELRYGDASTLDFDLWTPVALIGKPANHCFNVKWLISDLHTENKKIIEYALDEIDFYLVEKGEKNPWGYAQYHCNTGANMYSLIHWSYFPKGRKGERFSSKIINLNSMKERISFIDP